VAAGAGCGGGATLVRAVVAGSELDGGSTDTGGVVAGAESAGAGAVVLLAWRRLGGFTGDVLGAAAVVGETAGLLTLAGRW